MRLGAERPGLRLLEPLDGLTNFADIVVSPVELGLDRKIRGSHD
jgi:hypothetical protein